METLERIYLDKGLLLDEIKELAAFSGNDKSLFKRFLQRRLCGEPMDYIKGEIDFYGRSFKIDRNVYIPDKQTELLVKLFLRNITKPSRVVDVGTGCGNIAITLSKESNLLSVTACDIYPPGLECARNNAKRHGANVQFVESNYVDDLDIIEPEYIIADLPWGDANYLWEENDLDLMEHIPSHTCFHPEGILSAYMELICSIREKDWHPVVYIESGLIEEEHIRQLNEPDIHIEYVKFENYSVSVLDFTKR